MVADLDCTWSTTYHQPGSADRLRELDDRYELAGFTHYLRERNDGWLSSDEADALFTAASERGLLASLAAGPAWQADLRLIALRHPDVPVLCHHLGDVRAGDDAGLEELVASAAVPNIYVKASGFHYVLSRGRDYPWPDALFMLQSDLRRLRPEQALLGFRLFRLEEVLHLPPVTRSRAYSLQVFDRRGPESRARRDPGSSAQRHSCGLRLGDGLRPGRHGDGQFPRSARSRVRGPRNGAGTRRP